MKKIILLATTLFTLVMLIGCKKNENSTCKFKKSTFIGKWKITKIEMNGGDSTTAYFNRFPCQKSLILEFKSSGILSESNSSGCLTEMDRNWYLYSKSGKNYLIQYTSLGRDTVEILDFSCNSFSTNITGDTKYTSTKQ